jgi:acyl-CoA thioesterase FadM
MYPYFRMFKERFRFRNAPALPLTGTHVSHHMCLPWDLDPWNELNNGRTLTLYDLGRIPLSIRTGIAQTLRKKGWGLTVAGNTTRYRKRVRLFARIQMHSRCIGWDARFLYIEQSMWIGADCTSHIILRMAFTSARGIVPPEDVFSVMGVSDPSPALPDWVQTWINAESRRPWPPQRLL